VPEGDTIYRAAKTLHAALAGKTVVRFETVFPQLARADDDAPFEGRTVERVRSAGKHLIMELSGDLHLRTHMRMHGSWHIYRPGERWQRPRSDMRIVLETADFVAVGFNIPVAEALDSHALERQEDLRLIGPDFLADDFDFDEAHRRIRERSESEIGDVLLNQRVVAGIGNVFKSEVLFIGRVLPATKVRELPDEKIDELLRIGRKVMVANVVKRTERRETTGSLDPRASLFVYGRGGKPCRKCGTPIAFARMGKDARVTYWCPMCQV
jgi:endonuclease VIII